MRTILCLAAVLLVNGASANGRNHKFFTGLIDFHGDFQVIKTKNEYKYIPVKFDFSRHGYVIFEVKACHDAHINLMADNNVNRKYTYEIVIGAYKTYTLIRKQKKGRVLAYRNKKVLDCNKFVKFWMSWDHLGTIRVGTIDSWLVTLYDRKPYKITRVSVSTGYGATGEWKVYDPAFYRRQCCQQYSNEYCAVPETTCTLFTQRDQFNPLHYGKTYLKKCRDPALKFNIKECVCDYAWRTKCVW